MGDRMSERHIWDVLVWLTGGNAFGAAGLMGNLYAESGLNPRNLQQSFEKKLGMRDDGDNWKSWKRCDNI